MRSAWRRLAWLAGIALAWTVLTCPAGATPAQAAKKGPAAPGSPQAGYVGDDTCATCHDAESKSYHGTAHGRAANPRAPAAAHGCETCHGPGKAHVDSGGDKTKIGSFASMSAQKASETCTTCHDRRAQADWDGSTHDRHNLSCTTCHSVHNFKSPEHQLKTVSVIDTKTNTVVEVIQLDRPPRAIAFSPDAHFVYVSHVNSNVISVVDTSVEDVVASIKAGSLVGWVNVAAAGAWLIATDPEQGKLRVLDTSTRQELFAVAVAGAPDIVATTLDGNMAFVADRTSGSRDNISGQCDRSVVDDEDRGLTRFHDRVRHGLLDIYGRAFRKRDVEFATDERFDANRRPGVRRDPARRDVGRVQHRARNEIVGRNGRLHVRYNAIACHQRSRDLAVDPNLDGDTHVRRRDRR